MNFEEEIKAYPCHICGEPSEGAYATVIPLPPVKGNDGNMWKAAEQGPFIFYCAKHEPAEEDRF